MSQLEASLDPKQVEGVRQAYRKWRGMVQKDLLKSTAQLIAEQAQRRIRSTKSDPDGRPWPARKGARKKGYISGSSLLLVDTKTLLRSIRKARKAASLYDIGTDVSYAPIHQKGTAKIPKREFLGVGKDDVGPIKDHIDRWVERNRW